MMAGIHRMIVAWWLCLGVAGVWGQSTGPAANRLEFRLLAEAPTHSPVTALAFSPDGRQLLCGSNDGLEVRDWPGLDVRRKLAVEFDAILDIRFSPTNTHFLVAGGISGESGRVQLWLWPQCHLLQDLPLHDDTVTSVAWSPQGERFATASFDGSCTIFDRPSAVTVQRFLGHAKPILTIGYWDDSRILSGGLDHTIRLWREADGQVERELDNHVQPVYQLLLGGPSESRDQQRLISISEDRTVRLWQPEIGRLVRFQTLPSVPIAGDWSADRSSIWIGCADGELLGLDPESLAIRHRHSSGLDFIHRLLHHPDGPQLVVSGARRLQVYDIPREPAP